MSSEPSSHTGPRVALFVTCLADLYRPSVGFAALALLERAGCTVCVPEGQTCCGQPQWNSGDRKGTQRVARSMIPLFEDCDYMVAPSGSCIGMVRDWPEVFAGEAEWEPRARAVAAKAYELTSFLVDILGVESIEGDWPGTAVYHDSCTGLRKLGVKDQPRKLLSGIRGLEVRDLSEPEECCGFGGTFSVKYGDISGRMVDDKAQDIEGTGADLLLAGDVGCLLNMAGRLKRRGSSVQARHVAEVLAGLPEGTPAIGEEEP